MTASAVRPVAAASPVSPPGTPAPPERAPSPSPATLAVPLVLLGALLTGFVLYATVLSGITQQRDQDTRYDDFREELALATAPVDVPVAPGRSVAILEVPGLDLREVVVEGTTSEQLMAGPGHRRDTVLPGQPGVSVLQGRRTAFGGPFRDIDALRPGDPLRVVTGQGAHTYRVDGLRRPGDPLPPPVGAGSRLTLVTSDPPLRPTTALYLDATLVSPPVPVTATRVGTTEDERHLAGDRSAVVPLLLWTQLLLLAAVGTAWARQAWGPRQAHLALLPVLLAVLWNVYECVARLLPNTL